MRIKRKNGLKVAAITIALLLCLALAVGITGAWYQAKRQATGTLSMDQGIIIDYNGFGQTPNEGIWSRETTTKFLLFDETNAQPGKQIAVNAAGIRANAKSVDFYARVKLEYKFYNGETPVELADATKLIKTSSDFFGTNWVDGGSSDGYYYYATGTSLNKFNKGTQTFVDLFATGAEFVIEGEHFTGATSDGEGGGFRIDETTSINKIEVYLTLETLQGDVQTDELNTMGWKITKPVIFAEATGKMETSVKKESTTEDLNVSVAGATEVPINEVVFPYDTDTTLKFDSNNVEYVTLTYSNGESETFDAATYEVAENTFKLNAKSSKGTVTGYTVGLWNDSEYTGFTYSKQNYKQVGDQPTPYDIPNNGLAITGYFDSSNLTLLPELPNTKVSVRERDFKSIITFSSKDSFFEEFYSIAGSLQYPCKLSCEGVSIKFNNVNEIISWSEQIDRNFNLVSPVTITNSQLCVSTSIFAKEYEVTEIGLAAFYNKTNSSITIPENIKVIGIESFSSLSNLTTITIHGGITSIMPRAFAGCSKLETVIIDSATIAQENSSESELLVYATKVYVKTGLTVGTYITNSFTKAEASDKAGYDLYTKN